MFCKASFHNLKTSPSIWDYVIIYFITNSGRLHFPIPFSSVTKVGNSFPLSVFTACELTNSTALQLLSLNFLVHFTFLLAFCFRFDSLSLRSWILWLISLISQSFLQWEFEAINSLWRITLGAKQTFWCAIHYHCFLTKQAFGKNAYFSTWEEWLCLLPQIYL